MAPLLAGEEAAARLFVALLARQAVAAFTPRRVTLLALFATWEACPGARVAFLTGTAPLYAASRRRIAPLAEAGIAPDALTGTFVACLTATGIAPPADAEDGITRFAPRAVGEALPGAGVALLAPGTSPAAAEDGIACLAKGGIAGATSVRAGFARFARPALRHTLTIGELVAYLARGARAALLQGRVAHLAGAALRQAPSGALVADFAGETRRTGRGLLARANRQRLRAEEGAGQRGAGDGLEHLTARKIGKRSDELVES